MNSEFDEESLGLNIFTRDHLLKAVSIDTVQHVPSQRMTCGQARMIEVSGTIVLHANLLHDAARGDIGGHCKGHNIWKLKD